jgi:TP901 family phage tail tape measure protein
VPLGGLAETAELAVRISLKDDLSRGLTGLTSKVRKLDSGLGRAGKGVGQLGTGFARAGIAVGGAAVLGLGAAAKAAIDFEDAFAGIRKTVDESDLKAAGLTFEDLERSIRDMATTIPIAATELAAIGETAGALGVGVKDIDDFVNVVARLGVTTDLSSEMAAEALGKVGTILGLTGDEYETFADTLVHLGNVGASTESEIIEVTKRFAAMGKQAGLTNDEILGLASAASSLGIEPEAAGSALSRIFSNMATEIANGTKKGKAFAKITGDSLDELRDKINKGDSLGILQETLEGIAGLSRTEAASVLKALGITNVRDRNAILLMAQNLGFVKETLDESRQSVGALSEESSKRFDTIASKIQLLKNNFVEAGIAIGEGMLPALGRAADELSAFLKQPGNKNELKQIGEDIGEAIDGIDWKEVLSGAKEFVGVMKRALSFAKQLFDLFNTLPTEVKAALVGGAVLNKASGGLIGAGVGNILGGLGETAARAGGSRLPGIGKLFAQPVFVTNWPIGFGAGGPLGAGGKGGGFGKLALGLTGVGLAAVLADEFSDEIFGLGKTMGNAWRGAVEDTLGVKLPTLSTKDLEWPFGPKNTPTILPEVFGGNGLLGGTGAPTQQRPTAATTGAGAAAMAANAASIGAREAAKVNFAPLKTAVESVKTAVTTTNQATKNAVTNAQSVATRENSAQKAELGNIKNTVATQAAQQQALQRAQIVAQAANTLMVGIQGAGQAVRDAVATSATRTAGTNAASASRSAGARTASAMSSAATRIVGAIYAARPIIQSTNVVEKYTTIVRSGATSGSRRSGPLQ